MSSYFDDKSRQVRDLPDEGFLKALANIEEEVASDVSLITGDREFPDALRERAMGAIAVSRTAGNERARWIAERSHSSRMIEDLHEVFHDVARSRTETRFGRLSDSPVGDRERRDDHDTGGEYS